MVGSIRLLCEKNGITIAELERKVGFGNGTVARWDNSLPSVARVKSVADYFGVTVDQLLEDDGNDAQRDQGSGQ